MALPAGFLDELRGRLSLAGIAGLWVKWDQRKSIASKGDFWAQCPFHVETSSSFHVDDKKGFYYCFGCHAKGDVVTFIREKMELSFIDSIELLVKKAGIPMPKINSESEVDPFPTILELKDFMVENFSAENFRDIGALTGWSEQIDRHPRLLRSLSWGDPDYPACVIELLSGMERAKPETVLVVRDYLFRKFPSELAETGRMIAFEGLDAVLGYRFEKSRNDCVAVMMPFAPKFSPVYNTIKSLCTEIGLEARRADEVWNNSILINDILSLINHASVVICDLTDRNENVFYELGVAHAWSKKVIPITQREDDVPFDLRHHRFLTYLNNSEGLGELRKKLEPRIRTLQEKKI